MTRLVHNLALVALLAPALGAQTLQFTDGRSVKLDSTVRITRDSVRLPLEIDGVGSGEVTLPISALARVDWPRPAELDEAETELAAGRPAEALRKINPVVATHQPLAEVAGSWWGQAILARTAILAHLDRELDVMVDIESLRQSRANAGLVPAARIAAAAAWAETGKFTRASAVLEGVDRTTLPEADLARLYLVDARSLRSQGRHEDALLAALRVPVLLPAQTGALPAALLLAGESYRALDEPARAASALRELVEKFPASAEASRARSLLSDNSQANTQPSS